MNPHNKQYYAIIVHFGDPKPTHRLLNSLVNCHRPPDRIIVIDHALSPLKIKSRNNCLLVRPSHNLGYAAGFNRGLGILYSIGAKSGDIVICLNGDLVFRKNTMQKLRQWWRWHPADTLVGLVTQTRNSFIGYGVVNLFTGRTVLQKKFNQKLIPGLWTIPYIHGAAFAAPFGVLMENHGLSEKSFMYWEDVLLSVDLFKKKIPLRIATQAIVWHNNLSDQAPPSADKTYYLVRNGAMFLEQATPFIWRPYWWITNRARYLYHSAFSRTRKPVIATALHDAIYHRTGPRSRHTPNLK